MLLSCADRVSISKTESVVNAKSDWSLFYMQKGELTISFFATYHHMSIFAFARLLGLRSHSKKASYTSALVNLW